jgi:hypothetical protein
LKNESIALRTLASYKPKIISEHQPGRTEVPTLSLIILEQVLSSEEREERISSGWASSSSRKPKIASGVTLSQRYMMTRKRTSTNHGTMMFHMCGEVCESQSPISCRFLLISLDGEALGRQRND